MAKIRRGGMTTTEVMLDGIMDAITRIDKRLKNMEATMATKEDAEALADQVNTALDGLSTTITTKLTDLSADFTAALKALQDKIDAGGTAADLQPLVDKLTALPTKVTAISTAISDAISALDVTAEGVSGVPTP